MNRLRPATILVALALLPVLAHAAATHVPQWSMATDKDVQKAQKTFGFQTTGKVQAWPKKIAIPYFVMRFDKTQTEKDLSTTTLSFPESDYVALTDKLYDAVAKRFTDAGFEVVPRDQVLKAAAYAALEGDTTNKEGAGLFRAVPTGMKFLATLNGQPTKTEGFAALNKELGADASVAVFANFGLCPVQFTADTNMSGTKPCLRGNLTLPGLSILFVGGQGAKPAWTSRAYKETQDFVYNPTSRNANGVVESAEQYDAALISPLDAVSWHKSDFWGDRTGDADAGAYAEGIHNMLDVGFTLAMETFYDQNAAALEAAHVPRPARAPEPEGAHPKTLADLKAETAKAQSDLEAMKAAAVARPADGAQAAGTVTCYQLPAEGTTPETLLKRGIEATRLVDETIQIVPTIGPVRSVAEYTLADGTFTAKDAKGAWTGTGTYEGTADAWTAWKSQLAFNGGYTGEVTGTAEAGGLHMVTQVKDGSGEVKMTFDQHYKQLDQATCDAAWAKAEAYVAPPPAGTKPAKGKK